MNVKLQVSRILVLVVAVCFKPVFSTTLIEIQYDEIREMARVNNDHYKLAVVLMADNNEKEYGLHFLKKFPLSGTYSDGYIYKNSLFHLKIKAKPGKVKIEASRGFIMVEYNKGDVEIYPYHFIANEEQPLEESRVFGSVNYHNTVYGAILLRYIGPELETDFVVLVKKGNLSAKAPKKNKNKTLREEYLDLQYKLAGNKIIKTRTVKNIKLELKKGYDLRSFGQTPVDELYTTITYSDHTTDILINSP